MAEETIKLILHESLERGKCYIVSGNVTALGAGEDIQVRIGNDTETELLFLISATASFEQEFNYTNSSTFFQSLYLVADSGTNETFEYSIDDLAVKLNPECAEQYCSECFSLDNCGSAPTKEYTYLEWTNNDDGFGMNYSSSPLVHSLWVKGGLRNPNYSYNEDFFSTSGGSYFPVYADGIKTVELWVEGVPEYIHDALRLGVVHDEFTVNGVKYAKSEGSYSPDWETPGSLLAPVIIKLRESFQDTKNENC